jgi:hypothetical protein
MRSLLCFVLLIAATWFAACVSQKKLYELPEAMLPHVKSEYARRCDQGKILYDMNCAKCHNSTIKGKTIIPDFNPDELRGYALRISNAKHEVNMPDSLVSEEELAVIMTFLNYKKKNKPVSANKAGK